METNQAALAEAIPEIVAEASQTIARKRWCILAKVLRRSWQNSATAVKITDGNERTVSVRRFTSFGLLEQTNIDNSSLNFEWNAKNLHKISMTLHDEKFSAIVWQQERILTAHDLIGFNNTGNICIWPSEETLTAYVLSNLNAYNDKCVLELGGGFSCLAGLLLAKYGNPYAVHLTDGNDRSIECLKKTLCLNNFSCYIKCSVLKWENKDARHTKEKEKFDIILSADCIFFEEARTNLLDTIWYYLSPNGEALVMAPRRSKTLSLFVNEGISKGFVIKLTQRYNETVWQRHKSMKETDLYDEDLHFPILLQLTKQLLEGEASDKLPEWAYLEVLK